MRMERAVHWMVAVFSCVFTLAAYGQVAVGDNFNQLIKPHTEIAALGPDLFGDKVAMYTGTTEFAVTDVSIPGNNNLSVAIGRRFVVQERSKSTGLYPGIFGDWDLDIPHLHGVFAAASGWQVSTANQPNARCTLPAAFTNSNGVINGTPPVVSGTNSGAFSSAEYWSGNKLYVPGHGDKTMLVIDAGNTDRPSDGAQYQWATEDQWVFSCLPTTANGAPGEAFVAVSPSGVRYTFDWYVSRGYVQLQKPVTICTVPSPSCNTVLDRSEVWILPTKVQDRFGNWVTYSYDPANPWHLTSITSSDGRSINLSYTAGLVSTVTAGAQSWGYTYDQYGGLTTVTLPDNSTWTNNLSGILSIVTGTSLHSDCGDPPQYFGNSGTGVITHPSGAVGTFTFSARRHGRSYVPRNCAYLIGGASYATEPDTIDGISVDSKSISGAGFASPLTWTYTYGPDNRSFQQDCASGCPTTKTVTVTNPDTTWARHTFSNQYNSAEGRALMVETGQGSSVLKSETLTYVLNPAGQPYPSIIGRSPCYYCDNEGQLFLPLASRTISQDGVTYSTTYGSFDVLGRQLSATKSSSIGYSKSETTQYSDNAALWVLSQIARQTTNGVETSRIDYDPNTAQPTAHYVFSKLQSQYTFLSDGTLNKLTDGRSYTTTLSNWKRGIPQSIAYPDSYNETVAVDDLGRITSITDRANYVTSYQYDGVGRITRIDYPTGDEVAWYPTLYTYDFVTSAERGIAANHWRRTVSRGDSRRVTYFDVWLRPILTDVFSNVDVNSHANIRTDFDWNGQKTFVSYPMASSPDWGQITSGTTTTYDALLRPTALQQASEQGALTTSTVYLQGQLATQVTDPKQNVRTTNYQAFDEPAYTSPVLIHEPEGVTQSIGRDAFDSVTSITQSGNYGTESDSVTKYFYYDANHLLCRIVEPESGNQVMSYDGADNLSWSATGVSISGTDCGYSQVSSAAMTTYGYDQMNRVKTIQPPASTQSTVNQYDALGNLWTSTSGITTWTAGRNKLGQLTSESLGVSGNGVNVIRYAHDSYGSVQTITYPDGVSVGYAPDALGRATQVGAYATTISYYPDGSVQHFVFGNGTDYLAQQNARLLLSNLTYAKGSTINLSEDLNYDANANITSVNDLTGGPRSKSFIYDGLDRLTQAQAPGLWGTENYSYDPLNNIRSRTTAGQAFTYNYDAINRLSNVAQGASAIVSYQYDSRGNVSNRNGVSLNFDAKNQLLSVAGYDSYSYDANARRVLKAPFNGAAPTYYAYTADGQLLYQFDASTTKSMDYIYLGKKLLARSESYASSIRGNIDGVSIDGAGNASVTGWACSSGSTQSVNVDLYLGSASGTYIGRYAANQSSEAAVASACGVASGSFRFSIPLTVSTRSQYAGQGIYLYGINAAGTDKLLIWGSGNPVVPALPAAPQPPSTISATAAGDLSSIAVAWSTSTGATSYTLQENANNQGWSNVASGASTSFTLSNPSDGSYSFRVQACNVGGCGTYQQSSTVAIAHIPPTPASISVPGTGNGPLTVSWAGSAYATSYTLEQSFNNGSWSAIYSGASTSYSFSIGATGSYAYRVKACNTNGCSTGYATSGTVVVTIPPSSAPNISTPGTIYSNSYTVSWSGVSGATYYNLQEQVNGGGWSTVQSNGALSWGASGKAHNTTYGYHVQGCNAGGCGPWSTTGTAYVWLIPAVPAAPVLTASNGSHLTNLYVNWTAVSGATYYQLELTYPQEGIRPVVNVSGTYYNAIVHELGYIKGRITACNSYGCSGWSGYGQVYVQTPP